MMRPRSSGSKRAESTVEPTKSQNRIVSCRRSAVGAAVAASDAGAASVAVVAPSAPGAKFAPHRPQNFESGGFAWPHAAQGILSGAPQAVQKRCPTETSVRQVEHSMFSLRVQPAVLSPSLSFQDCKRASHESKEALLGDGQ